MAKITIEQLNNNMITHFDAVYGKLGELKQEQTLMNGALKRVEADVAVLKSDVGELKTGLRRVEDKLDAHLRQPAHAAG